MIQNMLETYIESEKEYIGTFYRQNEYKTLDNQRAELTQFLYQLDKGLSPFLFKKLFTYDIINII